MSGVIFIKIYFLPVRPDHSRRMRRFQQPAKASITMRPFAFINVTTLVLLVMILPNAGTAQVSRRLPNNLSAPQRATAADAELARLRADVIEKMKESRARSEKLMAVHELAQRRLTEEYQHRRELYNQGLISRSELIQSERALAMVIVRIDEVKRWMAEDDIAITEATMRDELLRLPALAVGGYSETATLVRFNGATLWSLVDAPKIEKFFAQTFGHTLPVSAYGQTTTHDRLRFDHRNAMDVALHPDSREGQSLLTYLRQAGIPFIAFRNAVPGAATGAHIHIGKPSLHN